MGLFNKYPYTDFHEMNLDWFLEEFKKALTGKESIDAKVEEATNYALSAGVSAANSATNAANASASATSANNSAIEAKSAALLASSKAIKSFNKSFKVSRYYVDPQSDGSLIPWAWPVIEEDLRHTKKVGSPALCLVLLSTYENGIFHMGESDEMLNKIIALCKEIDLPIETIKIHHTSALTSNFSAHIAEFTDFMISTVDHLTEVFAETDVDTIIPFNEFPELYGAGLYAVETCRVLNHIKTLGYYATVAAQVFYSVDPEVVEASSFFAFNSYPVLSLKMQNTTYEDVRTGVFSHVLNEMLRAKSKFNLGNKKIFISEIGVQDYWEALAKPENFVWPTTTPADGYPQTWMMKAVLEFVKDRYDVIGFNSWYMMPDRVIEVFEKYRRDV